jgi:hypothetical protein
LLQELIVSDWLLNLPVVWMAVIVFAVHISLRGQHLLGGDQARGKRSDAGIQGGLARNATTIGILFALLVGFIAVEVWSNFDKAKVAVASEASALRAVVLLAGTFPEEQKTYGLAGTRTPRNSEKRRRAGWNLIPSRLRNATARREARILRLDRSATGPLTKANGSRAASNPLISMVGAHGLEPWTR